MADQKDPGHRRSEGQDGDAIVETASGARIMHAGRLPLIDRGLGVRSTLLVSAETGAAGLTTGYTIIPAGGAIPWHTHDAEESIVMMDGEGLCELREGSYAIGRADATLIPAGVPHRIRNDGSTELRILWIYPSSTVVRRLIDEGRVLGHLDPYADT